MPHHELFFEFVEKWAIHSNWVEIQHMLSIRPIKECTPASFCYHTLPKLLRTRHLNFYFLCISITRTHPIACTNVPWILKVSFDPMAFERITNAHCYRHARTTIQDVISKYSPYKGNSIGEEPVVWTKIHKSCAWLNWTFCTITTTTTSLIEHKQTRHSPMNIRRIDANCRASLFFFMAYD